MSSPDASRPAGPRKIFVYLFGTPGRTYATVTLVVAIVSLAITITTELVSTRLEPWFILSRDLVLYATLIALCILLALKYMEAVSFIEDLRHTISEKEAILQERESHIRSLQDGINDAMNQLTSVFHQQLVNNHVVFRDIVDIYKTQLFTHLQTRNGNRSRHRLTADELRVLKSICFHLTLKLKHAFKEFYQFEKLDFDDDISVAVKLILSQEETIQAIDTAHPNTLTDKQRATIAQKLEWVLTVYRDPDTYSRDHKIREVFGVAYDIDENTAFRNIVRMHRDHYACNDLSQLGDAYENQNADWPNIYNATLIVPIGFEDMCFGFLAVDSMNTSRQNLFNDETANLLQHGADLLAVFFLLTQETAPQ